MTVGEICITMYLILVGGSTVLIWAALMASKPHENKATSVQYKHWGYSPLREHNTRPSRFHL